MAKVRTRAKKEKATQSNSSNSSTEVMAESFEQIFAVVDATITSALISGVSPDCLRAALSYEFLCNASYARSKSQEEIELWVSDPDLVWEPVLGAILNFVESFRGEIDAESETPELRFLQEECSIKSFPMSELEDCRHSKIAREIFGWLLPGIRREGRQNLILTELALLVEWFKVSTIIGDCGERNYHIVRQFAPYLVENYDHLLEL